MKRLICFLFLLAAMLLPAMSVQAAHGGHGGGRIRARLSEIRILHPLQGIRDRRAERQGGASACASGSVATPQTAPASASKAAPRKLP